MIIYKRFVLIIAVCSMIFLSSCEENREITVISREEGSGTRSAFTSAIGAEEKDRDGKTLDVTTELSEVTHSTAVMLSSVADNKNAIGYISMGSYNDIVKAVSVEGYRASAENIKNGSYRIKRSFSIVIPSEGVNEASADFISFIKSRQGQKIAEDKGYVSVGYSGEYAVSGISGRIGISGSSSVTPVMEALTEAYEKLNPDVQAEIQQSDSSSGIRSVSEGVSDIGMISRELSESEKETGLVSLDIALDGIVVIVNRENTKDDFSLRELRDIYVGNITDWSMLE